MALMCGGGGDAPVLSEAEKAAKKQFEDTAKEVKKASEKPIKMLLLGAGESGKSTIFKQMKVINKNGYTKKELMEFVGIVHANVITSMKSMMGSFEKLGENKPDDLAKLEEQFESLAGEDKLTPDLGKVIQQMWDHPASQQMYKRRNEFQLNDSAEYYFLNIERVSDPAYEPTVDDALRSRVRTTGIVQSDFMIKSMDFAMFDVGGQRNERRKWIHCFDNVDAVVFVAALSEFDQVLFEDETQNRLDEALDLFAQIVNSKWFKDSSLILFLNKKDLFEKKLTEKIFADYVNKNEKREPYTGPNEMQPCAEYQKKEFLKRNKSTEKSIYTHITTAIDTSNVKFVFNAVVAMILEENLKSSGLAG